MVGAACFSVVVPAYAQDKKPNIVMVMTDHSDWSDFDCYDSTR